MEYLFTFWYMNCCIVVVEDVMEDEYGYIHREATWVRT